MSRLYYEFATRSATSWTHAMQCDLCGKRVERKGSLPQRESSANTPEWEDGVLDNWGNFTVDPPKMLVAPGEIRPQRFFFDFCATCAAVMGDLLLEHGAKAGTAETRFLDAQGKPTGGRRPDLGTPSCAREVPGSRGSLCRRPAQHDGPCSNAVPAGVQTCCVCATGPDARRVVLYTLGELQQHAREAHEIQYSVLPAETGGRPEAWASAREVPTIWYADVVTALQAELNLIVREPRYVEHDPVTLAEHELYDDHYRAALRQLQTTHAYTPLTARQAVRCQHSAQSWEIRPEGTWCGDCQAYIR